MLASPPTPMTIGLLSPPVVTSPPTVGAGRTGRLSLMLASPPTPLSPPFAAFGALMLASPPTPMTIGLLSPPVVTSPPTVGAGRTGRLPRGRLEVTVVVALGISVLASGTGPVGTL